MNWWNSISLRTKITGVTVLMLTGGLLIAGAGTSALLKNYLVDQVDVRLEGAVQDWKSLLGPEASPENVNCSATNSKEFYWAFFHDDGSLKCDNWRGQDPGLRPDLDTFTIDEAQEIGTNVFVLTSVAENTDWRLRTRDFYFGSPDNQYSLVIGINLVRTDDTMANYISIFFGFGLIVVIFAAGLTRFLVTRTFTPLREVEQTAAAIAGGDFSLRLQQHGNNTEVGRLNQSLNTMLHRIDRALEDRAHTIEQMRRFIGDAGHELRTPLVTVRGYAELYRMGAIEGDENLDQAMERIEKEAIRMGGLVEDLLELARLDQERPMEQQAINMIPLLQEIAMDARVREPHRIIQAIIPEGLDPEVPERFRLNESGELPDLRNGFAHPNEPLPKTTVIPVIRDGANPKNNAAKNGATKEVISEDEAKIERGRKLRNRSKSFTGSITGSFTGPIAIAGAAFDRLRGKRREDGTLAATTPADQPPVRAKKSAPKVAPLVLGDDNKIRQVFINLLANALRFTPPDNPIELELEVLPKKSVIQVSVIDHGEGIPPQIRDKIFRRFWRADTSRTRDTGGSGLGLAIVSAIVRSHHGRVWAEETPGGGATFKVQFPILK